MSVPVVVGSFPEPFLHGFGGKTRPAVVVRTGPGAKALARLTPRERMLVTGHYLRDVQYEALAEALGMPLGTVKTHLFRAKAKLRTLLEEEL